MILKRLFIFLTVVFSLMLPLNTFGQTEELEKGQGTVKEAIKNGNKEFYTIVTPTEQTYYLVVDYEKDTRNVYFLKAVDEVDLIDLAGVNEVIYTPEETTIESTTETTSQEDINNLIEEDKQETEQKSFNIISIIAFVLFIALIVFIIYSKIKDKNKPETFEYDDEEITEEDDTDEEGDDSQEVIEGLKNKKDRL